MTLIDRLHAGPSSYALDSEIAGIVGNPVIPPPTYTTSIDAALGLVPDGWRLSLHDNAGEWFAQLFNDDGPGDFADVDATAKGEGAPAAARAICIVSLKAWGVGT